jgi:DNA-binding NarL/FixJ family response regulator
MAQLLPLGAPPARPPSSNPVTGPIVAAPAKPEAQLTGRIMDGAYGPHGTDTLTMRQLTARERGVLACMAEGLSNAGIGHRMALSAKTVECHVSSIFTKLNLHPDQVGNRRVQAVLIWLIANPA